MLSNIKANKQSIEYYEVAQELLDLAQNDAGEFISNNEDRKITGQQVKRETSNWINRLDYIIDDLEKQPDPLGLLSKAKQLKKNLQQVVSRPSDELTYDMMNADGKHRGQNSFWTKLSTLFTNITAAEPAIIRSKPQMEADFVLPKESQHLTSVEAQQRVNQRHQTTAIPTKPKKRQMFVDREAPRTSLITHTDNKVDLDTRQKQEVESRTDLKPTSVVEAAEIEKEQKVDDPKTITALEKARLINQQQAALDAEIINRAIEISNQRKEQSEKIYKELENRFNDLEVASEVLSTKDLVQAFNSLRTVGFNEKEKAYKNITEQWALFISEIEKSDLFSFINDRKFLNSKDMNGQTYGSRFLGSNSTAGTTLDNLAFEFKALLKKIESYELGDDDFTADKLEYVSSLYGIALVDLRDINIKIKAFQNSGMSTIYSENEGEWIYDYGRIAEGLATPGSKIYEAYIKELIPNSKSDKAIGNSIEKLKNRIEQNRLMSAKAFAMKARSDAKQMNSVIQMIERGIEEPAQSNKLQEVEHNAPFLYKQLDNLTHVMEGDSSKDRVILSLNKLKNNLAKIARDAKQVLSPEFKGDIIRSSQSAIQNLEIAIENSKHLPAVDASPRVISRQIKPSIPEKPKRNQMLADKPATHIEKKPEPVVVNTHVENIEETDEDIRERIGKSSEFKEVVSRIEKIAESVKRQIVLEMENKEYGPEAIKESAIHYQKLIDEAKKTIDGAFLTYMHSNTDTYKPASDQIRLSLGGIISEVQLILASLNDIPLDSVTILDRGYQQTIEDNKNALEADRDALKGYIESFNVLGKKNPSNKMKWLNNVTESITSIIDTLEEIRTFGDHLQSTYLSDIDEYVDFIKDISNPKSVYYEIFLNDHFKPGESYSDEKLYNIMESILGDTIIN